MKNRDLLNFTEDTQIVNNVTSFIILHRIGEMSNCMWESFVMMERTGNKNFSSTWWLIYYVYEEYSLVVKSTSAFLESLIEIMWSCSDHCKCNITCWHLYLSQLIHNHTTTIIFACDACRYCIEGIMVYIYSRFWFPQFLIGVLNYCQTVWIN